MRQTFIASAAAMALAAVTFAAPSAAWAAETITFDALGAPGAVPDGFKTARSGRGKRGKWMLVNADDAPSGDKVVAQVSNDRTNYRFPVLVYQGKDYKDVDLSVKFKAISGGVDQAAGLVWRYRDRGNYYVVRANALEDNVVLYKMQKGRRRDLPLVGKGRTYGAKAPVPRSAWHTLRVTVKGPVFTVYLNDQELYKVKDTTFKRAGKVGLWTKADSVTQFDDLMMQPN
ncbi:MAG: family 16 glycoside hydrolase [Pseudomonadota bacterium]